MDHPDVVKRYVRDAAARRAGAVRDVVPVGLEFTLSPGLAAGWKEPSGGSQPVNWAVINLATPAALTVGSPVYLYQVGDLTISSQSGTDFSLSTDPNNTDCGCLKSAAGGRFQSAAYFESPTDATLDGGSTKLRRLWLGAIAGDSDSGVNPFATGGFDATIDIVVGADGTYVQDLRASTIGYTNPGGIAASVLQIRALGLTGTDSIPLGSSGPFSWLVWQV